MRSSRVLTSVFAGLLCLMPALVPAQVPPVPGGSGLSRATVVDWRTAGYVSGVRNQGSCGSSWLFPAVAMLESRLMIALNLPNVDLDYSEQRLLSCVGGGNNCASGSWVAAMNYLQTTGTPREACFPYQSSDLVPCTAVCADAPNQLGRFMTWSNVPADEISLKSALSYGPIGAYMDVYSDFYSYSGGVYSHLGGTLAGGHYVLIVGYDNAQQCWIAKNSWGTTWGEAGYFRIAYVSNCRFGEYATAGTATGSPPPIGWGKLQSPSALTTTAGVPSGGISGRLWIDGVTKSPGAPPRLTAELGYGPDGSNPSANPAWQWTPAVYSANVGASDEYTAALTVATPGTYDYCYRYSFCGSAWVYADLDSSSNGYSPGQAGALTVTAPGAVEDALPSELSFALQSANPVAGPAHFRFGLPRRTRAELSIHDVTGRCLVTLAAGQLDAGYHAMTWAGEGAAHAGVYFARFRADGRSFTQALTVLR
jgi:hypothetical protein